MFKVFSILFCFISHTAHLLNRMYLQHRREQFLFLSAVPCVSIFMLPKQSLAQQKQMEGNFRKRWDFKTINLLESSLVFSFPWKQEFVGICRHDRNLQLLCYCCPLSVSKEMDFRSCFHLIKGTHWRFFSMPFCPPFIF